MGFIADSAGRVVPVNKEAEEWYLMGLNDDLKNKNRKTYQKIISEICKLDTELERPQIF